VDDHRRRRDQQDHRDNINGWQLKSDGPVGSIFSAHDLNQR